MCGVPTAPHVGANHAHRLVSPGACEEPPIAPVALLVARRTVLDHLRSIENVVRGITREDGLELGKPSRQDFAPRVREMAGDEPELMAILEPLLAVLAPMIEQLARLTKQVLDISSTKRPADS